MKKSKHFLIVLIAFTILFVTACDAEDNTSDAINKQTYADMDMLSKGGTAPLINFWNLGCGNQDAVKETYFRISGGDNKNVGFSLIVSPEGNLRNTGAFKKDNGFETYYITYSGIEYKVVENTFLWDSDVGGGRGHIRYVYWKIRDVEYFLKLTTNNDFGAALDIAVTPLASYLIDNHKNLLELNFSDIGYEKFDEEWKCLFTRALKSGNTVLLYSYEVRPLDYFVVNEMYTYSGDNYYTYEHIDGAQKRKYISCLFEKYAVSAMSTVYDNDTDNKKSIAELWVTPDNINKLTINIGLRTH